MTPVAMAAGVGFIQVLKVPAQAMTQCSMTEDELLNK